MSTTFSKETYPFIFKNTFISLLDIKRLHDTSLSRNILEFIQINQTINDLNSTIIQFQVSLYHAELNSNLLNRYVFFNLSVLDLNGIIRSIQPNAFRNLEQLDILRIRTEM